MAILSKPAFPFMKLPPELRYEVYAILLSEGNTLSYQNFHFASKPRSGPDGIFLCRPDHFSGDSLLSVSREVRQEFLGELLRSTKFVLRGSVCPLQLFSVLNFLEELGPARASLRSMSIDWYSSAWTNNKTADDDTAALVASLLKQCSRLARFEVTIPKGKGLGYRGVPPTRYHLYCGLVHLRSVKDIKTVIINAQSADLCEWLRAGMGGMPITGCAEEIDIEKWMFKMFDGTF